MLEEHPEGKKTRLKNEAKPHVYGVGDLVESTNSIGVRLYVYKLTRTPTGLPAYLLTHNLSGVFGGVKIPDDHMHWEAQHLLMKVTQADIDKSYIKVISKLVRHYFPEKRYNDISPVSADIREDVGVWMDKKTPLEARELLLKLVKGPIHSPDLPELYEAFPVTLNSLQTDLNSSRIEMTNHAKRGELYVYGLEANHNAYRL